jgi:hypothetical protein
MKIKHKIANAFGAVLLVALASRHTAQSSSTRQSQRNADNVDLENRPPWG